MAKKILLLPPLRCRVCGHRWKSRPNRTNGRAPRKCPVCFSVHWKDGRSPLHRTSLTALPPPPVRLPRKG